MQYPTIRGTGWCGTQLQEELDGVVPDSKRNWMMWYPTANRCEQTGMTRLQLTADSQQHWVGEGIEQTGRLSFTSHMFKNVIDTFDLTEPQTF